MAKIMTNHELIARMKELLNEPNYYGSGGSNWSSWVNGGWYVDCTCSIKAILWGGRFIPANRGKAHAGCSYGSNGVPDFTPASCVNWTGATKGNFGSLIPGEILLMTSHGHAGLYIGNGQVIEVTPAWTGGTPGCQISQIGANGERIKNGRQVYSWEYHGKIPVIDYIDQPTPTPTDKVNVFYRVKTKENGWLDEVRNLEDYAGLGKNSIIDFMVRVDRGSVWYQAHVKGKGWLPKVTGYNTNDYYNGYAGDDINAIDCVRIYYNTPDDIIRSSGYKKAKYRINNLPWVYDNEKCPNGDDFAGNMGEAAYKLEVVIE